MTDGALLDTGLDPARVQRIVTLHDDYYRRAWGFGDAFRDGVAGALADFAARYDASGDCTWVVLQDGVVEASLTIDGHDPAATATAGAHLRWFVASDALRGQGWGARLLDAAVGFCRARGYPEVWLWTFAGLEPARHLYEKAGFVLAEARRGRQWGSEVEERRYVLTLD
ncbi:MAG: GNAT family N-acetyltransferase [Gammaproteobacteria bacterium]